MVASTRILRPEPSIAAAVTRIGKSTHGFPVRVSSASTPISAVPTTSGVGDVNTVIRKSPRISETRTAPPSAKATRALARHIASSRTRIRFTSHPAMAPRICIGWNTIQIPAANRSTMSAAQGAKAPSVRESRFVSDLAMQYPV